MKVVGIRPTKKKTTTMNMNHAITQKAPKPFLFHVIAGLV